MQTFTEFRYHFVILHCCVGGYELQIKSERDHLEFWRTMAILLNRDIRTSGTHIPHGTRYVAEVTKMVLKNRFDYESLLATGWKPR
jgi:hypothetical protein